MKIYNLKARTNDGQITRIVVTANNLSQAYLIANEIENIESVLTHKSEREGKQFQVQTNHPRALISAVRRESNRLFDEAERLTLACGESHVIEDMHAKAQELNEIAEDLVRQGGLNV